MMSSYTIFLTPTQADPDPEPIELMEVELGFNQLGWLVLSDDKREVVACFTPGSVQYVLREGDSGDGGQLVLLDVEQAESVN